MYYFLITIYAIISLFGTVGNLLAIIGFWRIRTRPGFSPISCFFILCLAVSDLLLCCVVIPMKITVHLSEELDDSLQNPLVLCRFDSFLKASLVPFSTLLMGAVAVDRYLFLCRPADNFMTKPIAFTMLGILAGISFIIGILAALLLTVSKTSGDDDGANSDSDEVAVYCHLNPDFAIFSPILKYFQLGVVWTSVGVATTLYGIVYASVLRRRQTVWRSKRGLSSPNASRGGWPRSVSRQTLASTASYFKSAATPSTIVPSSPSALTFTRSLSINPFGQSLSSTVSFLRQGNNGQLALQGSVDQRSINTQNFLNVPNAGGFLARPSEGSNNHLSPRPSLMSFYMPGYRNQFIERRVSRQLPPAATDASSVLALALSSGPNNAAIQQATQHCQSPRLSAGSEMPSFQNVPTWQATYVLRKNIKAAVMLFTVTLVFVIFFMPATLILLNLLPTFSDQQFELKEILFNLHFASSATNPFIYVFLNSTIRKEMKRLFLRAMEKCSLKRRLSRQESKRSLKQRRDHAKLNKLYSGNTDSRASMPGRIPASAQISSVSNPNPANHLDPNAPLLLHATVSDGDATAKDNNTIVLETIRLDGSKSKKQRVSDASNNSQLPSSIMISVTVADDERKMSVSSRPGTPQPPDCDKELTLCEDARFDRESMDPPTSGYGEDDDDDDDDMIRNEEDDDVPAIVVNNFFNSQPLLKRKPVVEIDSLDTDEMETETTI